MKVNIWTFLLLIIDIWTKITRITDISNIQTSLITEIWHLLILIIDICTGITKITEIQNFYQHPYGKDMPLMVYSNGTEWFELHCAQKET